MGIRDVLETAAAIVTALTIIFGALGWLVWPRFARWVERIAAHSKRVERELDPADSDSTAAAARVAANEMPRLRELIESLMRWQAERESQRIPERIQLIELQVENHERRIGSAEQALISGLGNPLERRKDGTP